MTEVPENATLVSVDVAAPKMFPPESQELVERIALRIDHHGSSTPFAEAELVDPAAGACAEIIYDVIRQMGLPPKPCYPFVRLGAKLFGHFDLEECSAIENVKKAKKPVILYHGESDAFVPCWMSEKLYEACPSRKRLVKVPGAGHGLAFPVDQEGYLKAAREFFGPEASAE